MRHDLVFGSFQRSQVPFDVTLIGRKAISQRQHLSYDGIYCTLNEKSIENEDAIATARDTDHAPFEHFLT